ncbi:hypothetical protein [Natronorubrum halophilum]|uniref:hypothetical protein n=1 Tax=Natronorubrum halophilum TaxID=1702106 RepID=UPI000EF66904|nr:hypothetical protein [Natronorubrum halophilum]
MRRIFFVVVVVAVALAMGMGVGPVAAQDGNETENATAEPAFEAEFGDGLRITEYELANGTATITFDADRPRTVTVSDALAGVGEEGAVQVPSEDYNLERGETTISMDVREMRGASTVGVSVSGTTVRLSSKIEEPSEGDENPFRHFGGESGLFSGILMTVGLAGVGTWHVLRSEESGVMEA